MKLPPSPSAPFRFATLTSRFVCRGFVLRVVDCVADGALVGLLTLDGFGPDTDLGDLAGVDEFDGIPEEVGETLSQAGFVAEHNGKVSINVDVCVRRLELGIRLEDAPQKGVGVHGFRLKVLAHHSAVLEGVGDELVHPVGGVHDLADVFQAAGMEALGAFLQENAA